MSYDPKQRFLSLTPGGNGIIYAIQADGLLLWYRNTGWQTGAATWAAGNGLAIGSFWHQFTTVLAAADGQIFAFSADGTLRWYRYLLSNSNTGAGSWAAASGSVIGNGFDRFKRVFGGFDNVLYGEDDNGNLFWYRYTAGNGSFGWANGGNGRQIGSGWKEFPNLWADPNGVIYGVRQGDDLRWWRYVVSNLSTGAGAWANSGNSITIGVGWGSDSQRQTFSNTSGTIYAIGLDTAVVPGDDSTLLWYRLQNSEHIDTAGVSWVNGTGLTVGTGFTWQDTAALQGYPSSLSTPQGGSVDIKVSTTFSSYDASVLQVVPEAGSPVTVVAPVTHTGRLQLLPSGYRSAGCGWSTDFTVPIPSGWPSGIYSAHLVSSSNTTQDVVFCVRPSAPQNRIAYVVPTNTYTAYNTWGGHDQYTIGQAGVQRTITMQRPNVIIPLNGNGVISHTLFSDLFLLRWMTANNIQFDCYTDVDLDATGATWLTPANYKAVVLGSHPEYWSTTARQNLVNFLGGGGRCIGTGGNSIYERVSYTTDRSAVIFRTPTGDRDLFADSGLPESDVLGVDFNPETYMDFARYRVVTNHAFLNGTGLSVGSTFGAAGYNGAASGWEVDDTATSTIPGRVVIASGRNPNGGGDMVYVPKPLSGWAFAVGSIAFNGAVPVDPAIQKILTNVFTAAVA